jgi:hypothetical protein
VELIRGRMENTGMFNGNSKCLETKDEEANIFFGPQIRKLPHLPILGIYKLLTDT